MAVERIKEFTIDLGDLVKTRLEGFVNSRKKVHALEETNFQRSVIDNDLTYQAQLDYRNAQIIAEGEKKYPDIDFIDELKTSASSLKKMVRHRKFRDAYFTFLTDLASGRKAIEDHISYLQNSLADDTLDREIKDELENEYVKAIETKRTKDRQIIDSQISFYNQDGTAKSIDKAIEIVKSQLTQPDIQKDSALKASYEMQLKSLEKEKMEVGVEDKMTWMAVQLVGQDRKNPSLWKLETFGGFTDNAGTDMPVNIGGVRYASEKEYWQVTMNNYVLNSFAGEYVNETKGEATLIWNKMGLLPDTYIKNLLTTNQIIKNQPELQNYQQVILSSVQDAITSALTFKARDLTAKYYLDQPDIATEADYQKAKQELENLKVLFGDDYSLNPDIQALETKLIAKRVQTTKEILATAAEYAEAEGITLQEAIEKYGPTAAVELPAETFLEKTPMEAAQEAVKAGEEAPAKYEEEKKAKEEAAKAAEPTPPAPTPTPAPDVSPTGNTHLVRSGENASVIAAKYGVTVADLQKANPQYSQFVSNPNYVQAGWTLNVPKTGAPAPAPAPAPTPTPEPKPEPTPTPEAPEPAYHTVASGETLWGIAQKYLGSGAKWTQLKTPEGIGFTEESAKKLQIGQKILIPK